MLVYEYKVDATKAQYARMEEAIRVGQFVRNKCLRLWMDGANISANDLQIYCSQLAKDFPFVACLNSQARQSAADRTWQAINRFYQNCRQMKPGKKGYPRFRHRCRSVEYKQTGWKLEPDGRHLTFTDGCGIGRVRLLGTRDVASFPVSQIKRVRLLRRADGYYVQFALTAERCVAHVATGRVVGIDVGLISFYTDSNGRSIVNPRYLRNSERRLRVLSQRFSRKNTSSLGAKKPKVNYAARHRAKHNKYPPQQMSYATTVGTTLVPIPFSPDTSPPGNGTKRRSHSAKWQRARIALARKQLKVQRQREDFARKQASALVSSHDLIALEDLQVRNLVKNRRLAKSISDVCWSRFRHWVEYYGKLHGIPVIAVPPQYTSQYCSQCSRLVAKSLSMRTHVCPTCGLILDRDHNAARNILARALASHSAPAQQLRTVGHTET